MAKETSFSGESLTRHMAYVFPEEHLEQINANYGVYCDQCGAHK